MVIGASVVSLVGVGVTLGEASHTSGALRVELSGAAILTVADRVIVIVGGQVVTTGSHRELVRNDERYAAMVIG